MFENYDSWLASFQENPSDVGLEPHEEHYGYDGTLIDLRVALFRPKTTKLQRADAVRAVLLARQLAYRRRVAAYADQRFRQAVDNVPSRLPIEEHRIRVRNLKRRWYEPLQALLGGTVSVDRKRSHSINDLHWHRFQLLENRSVKSRSKKRKAWLKANARGEAQIRAERNYNVKRREARAAKRIAKVFEGGAS